MIKSLQDLRKKILEGLIWRLPRSNWAGDIKPPKWTPTQELFCEWNAQQLGIDLQESRKRYEASWGAIRHGHGGPEYRDFCDLSYRIYRVFHDDALRESFASYQFHGPMHLLRMLSYGDPAWPDEHPIVQNLQSRSTVRILDFGCGLAQMSRSLATKLKWQKKEVTLTLVDIPTVRKEFLLWLCAKTAIPATFLDCSPAVPIPPLPPCDVCIATEVFEHLHEPLPYLAAMHSVLQPGGLLRTNVADHPAEYGHVSTNLDPLRRQLREWGYEELQINRVFRKPL